MSDVRLRDRRILHIALAAYAGASLLHYAHNAVFLSAYPNMPHWISGSSVLLAWLGLSAVGVSGLALVHSRFRVAGLATLAVYALLGYDGLAHYALASPGMHSPAMNATIILEVMTATLLLMALASDFRAPRQG